MPCHALWFSWKKNYLSLVRYRCSWWDSSYIWTSGKKKTQMLSCSCVQPQGKWNTCYSPFLSPCHFDCAKPFNFLLQFSLSHCKSLLDLSSLLLSITFWNKSKSNVPIHPLFLSNTDVPNPQLLDFIIFGSWKAFGGFGKVVLENHWRPA